MGTNELVGRTVVVVGASKGFGRASSIALASAGARVVGVARQPAELETLQDEIGDAFVVEAADGTDPNVATRLISQYRPNVLILCAGATPLAAPIHHQTWESFSHNWQVDTQLAFHWIRESLLRPLTPGSTVITFSSGAALRGSPLSGGYAGAKAGVGFISTYAAVESQREQLGIRFITVLPQLSPATELGAHAAAAYAARDGIDLETAIKHMGSVLTPEIVGDGMVRIATDATLHSKQYQLSAAGLVSIDDDA